MTTVFLTNVGVDPETGYGFGTDPEGNRQDFYLSDEDSASLKRVLYSDLAVNFSGVEVDTTDLLGPAPCENYRSYERDGYCETCGFGPHAH